MSPHLSHCSFEVLDRNDLRATLPPFWIELDPFRIAVAKYFKVNGSGCAALNCGELLCLLTFFVTPKFLSGN